jgi:hypothetical protein
VERMDENERRGLIENTNPGCQWVYHQTRYPEFLIYMKSDNENILLEV